MSQRSVVVMGPTVFLSIRFGFARLVWAIRLLQISIFVNLYESRFGVSIFIFESKLFGTDLRLYGTRVFWYCTSFECEIRIVKSKRSGLCFQSYSVVGNVLKWVFLLQQDWTIFWRMNVLGQGLFRVSVGGVLIGLSFSYNALFRTELLRVVIWLYETEISIGKLFAVLLTQGSKSYLLPWYILIVTTN